MGDLKFILGGTSPRAWGLCVNFAWYLATYRFIPTCVGFMLGYWVLMMIPSGSSPRAWGLCARPPSWRGSCSVHPHVRGAYVVKPKGRGQLARFIPTCVGFMSGRRRRSSHWPVHPHVRGVYMVIGSRRFSRLGSSPRAWGLSGTTTGITLVKRFIPTCVGFMQSPCQCLC